MRRVRGWCFPFLPGNSQILHHAVIAMEHDVAVGDEIAGETLVAGAEGEEVSGAHAAH